MGLVSGRGQGYKGAPLGGNREIKEPRLQLQLHSGSGGSVRGRGNATSWEQGTTPPCHGRQSGPHTHTERTHTEHACSTRCVKHGMVEHTQYSMHTHSLTHKRKSRFLSPFHSHTHCKHTHTKWWEDLISSHPGLETPAHRDGGIENVVRPQN